MLDDTLNNQQQAAAQLLAQGTLEKQEIAKRVGISRTTLYHYMKQAKFIAEVDRLKQDFKTFGKGLVESKLTDAVNGYWKLLEQSNNDMVRAKGYEFFIERSLGKLTNSHTISTEVTNIKQVDEDILEAEQEQWAKELEEGE
ncbi:phBC6A51 family helix-turn-helix protein [Mesobacillus foraminis]|uniref:Putative insertion element HTH domain-containing protein n=1 Tax=Mesobacillus foraminis TaxID=279826 RepID=A0A4R2BG56_9BACI|nr:phBC6A51 family helix-turn-helix protein [Mesobacillus foraminis]TCN25493.1 putative insertion element HTH domain-containing protein [Mesobacillus foraminis]